MRHIALLLLISFIAGCGKSGPQIAPVHGRVTLGGQPLASADVQFQADGGQRPSTGRTNAEGRYELMFKRGQPGAIVGAHIVRIWVSPEVVKRPPIIAAKFNTQSELRRDVKAGQNEFDFEVTAGEK